MKFKYCIIIFFIAGLIGFYTHDVFMYFFPDTESRIVRFIEKKGYGELTEKEKMLFTYRMYKWAVNQQKIILEKKGYTEADINE